MAHRQGIRVIADGSRPPPPGSSREDRAGHGRALRASVPRTAHAIWAPTPDRPDPVSILVEQGRTRVEALLPIRYGRMAESPFAFFRGGAAIMAHDLASTPVTGLDVQACGDAHVSNFGKFASPERNLVFDINDFDETLPGPWEWDVKRLCTSLQVVARQRNFPPEECERVVLAAAREYRLRVGDYSTWRILDLWYERAEIKRVIDAMPSRYRSAMSRDAKRALRKDHLRAVTRLTEETSAGRRFVEDPPLVVRLENLPDDTGDVDGVVESYRESVSDYHRAMFDRFRIVDVARKVVGVGSVGTLCWIALCEGRGEGDSDLIVLQVKEAPPSVLEPYTAPSALGHQGRRVVLGQRLTQAAGDIFLGWAHVSKSARDYYVRQLWDYKGQSDPMIMEPRQLQRYGALCGWILARAHVRTGDGVAIAAYLGRSDRFERAIVEFARAYAVTNESDHAALLRAIAEGRIEARAVD